MVPNISHSNINNYRGSIVFPRMAVTAAFQSYNGEVQISLGFFRLTPVQMFPWHVRSNVPYSMKGFQ